MQREGVTFPEAIRMLADMAGIELEPMQKASLNRRSNATPGSNAGHHDKKSLFEVMNWVVQTYHEHLIKSSDAQSVRDYLAERHISVDSIKRFRVGVAPNKWDWLISKAESRSISISALHAVDAVAKSSGGKQYDRFRGRVLFPIADPQGRAIALGGRILPELADEAEKNGQRLAKYINATETTLYSKSHQLYGLDLARETIQRTRCAVVVEGYTDVIMCHQYGLKNAVAVCGTALAPSHLRLLKRYCDRLVLLLDGDSAGQKRTNEILELFVTADLDVRIGVLPEGYDPCDFLVENGAEAMESVLANSVDAIEHKIRTSCQGFDPLEETHRAHQALEEVLGLIAKSPTSQLEHSKQLRFDQVLGRLSRQFGVDIDRLRSRLKEMRASASRRPLTHAAAIEPIQTPSESSDFRYGDLNPSEQELFEICALFPELIGSLMERVSESYFQSETARAMLKTYVEMDFEGLELDFETLMAHVEDAALKSVFVSVRERADQKSRFTRLDAQARLQSLFRPLERAELEQMQRQLTGGNIGEDEQLELLLRVVAKNKSAQEN